MGVGWKDLLGSSDMDLVEDVKDSGVKPEHPNDFPWGRLSGSIKLNFITIFSYG